MPKKIFLIDDRSEKYFAIRDFLDVNYEDYVFLWAKNYRQAQNILLNDNFDIIILDMSFERHGATSEESTFNGLAGLHVLQFMWRSRIKVPVIICTTHSNFSDPDFGALKGLQELENYVKKYFRTELLGCVLMHADMERWHDKLGEILDNANIK